MSYIKFIVSLKNAVKASRRETVLPFSKLNLEISKVLQKLGFIESFKEDKKNRLLAIKLAYNKRTPVLTDVRLISKPKLRRYIPSKDILGLERRGKTILILSTSQGVMTGKEAVKKGIGGQALFTVV